MSLVSRTRVRFHRNAARLALSLAERLSSFGDSNTDKLELAIQGDTRARAQAEARRVMKYARKDLRVLIKGLANLREHVKTLSPQAWDQLADHEREFISSLDPSNFEDTWFKLVAARDDYEAACARLNQDKEQQCTELRAENA